MSARGGGRAPAAPLRRPVLRPGIEVLEASDGDIYLLRPDAADLALRAPEPEARELVRALRDGRPVAPGPMLDALAGADVLAEAAVPGALDPRSARRYDRQLHYFAGALPAGAHREDAQERLRAATVTVLGVGGLGTWTAAALAQSGVGRIVLVDDDHVDDTNLNRQVLFAEADLGRPKVDAAAERLRAMNADLQVDPRRRVLDGMAAVANAVAGADVVVATADRPADRIATWVDDACRHAGIPHVSAGQFPPRIRVGPFVIPGRTPGLCCLHAALRAGQPLFDELMALRAQDPGTAATLAGPSAAIGGLLATDVLHHLTGIAVPATAGRSMLLDLRTFETEWQELPAERCAACRATASR